MYHCEQVTLLKGNRVDKIIHFKHIFLKCMVNENLNYWSETIKKFCIFNLEPYFSPISCHKPSIHHASLLSNCVKFNWLLQLGCRTVSNFDGNQQHLFSAVSDRNRQMNTNSRNEWGKEAINLMDEERGAHAGV